MIPTPVECVQHQITHSVTAPLPSPKPFADASVRSECIGSIENSGAVGFSSIGCTLSLLGAQLPCARPCAAGLLTLPQTSSHARVRVGERTVGGCSVLQRGVRQCCNPSLPQGCSSHSLITQASLSQQRENRI